MANRSTAEMAAKADLDAEAAVLSAALLKDEAAAELIELLDPEDFYADSNRRICGALFQLLREDKRADVITVASLLREQNRLDQVGGTPYLAQLSDATPAICNMAEHARIVRDLARLRKARATFQVLAAQAAGEVVDVQAFLDEAEAATYRATSAREDVLVAKTYRETVTDTYNATLAPPEQRFAIRTGYAAFDQHTGGMSEGDLVIVAGRPVMGKTSIAMDWAEHAALCTGVVVFSLEMPREQLMLRSLSRRAKIFHKRLRLRTLAQDEWERLAEAIDPLARLPIIVDDNPKLTPAKLRARVRRHAAKLRRDFNMPLGLVVIDYLQLMASDGHYNGNRNAEVEEISRENKALAKSFECCVMALSQLSRPAKDAKVRPPQLHDLRDSGAIEQDADTVVMIHRPDKYKPYNERDGKADIIVAKGRNCGETVIEATFDGRYTQFTEVPDQQPEAF
jgi:replicative DNA helicase